VGWLHKKNEAKKQKKTKNSSPSAKKNALGEGGLPRVPPFPECHGLSGTRGRPSSPSAFLPRVPDIWHSGKPEALGEFPLSRSD
jgi:hypothetical protein